MKLLRTLLLLQISTLIAWCALYRYCNVSTFATNGSPNRPEESVPQQIIATRRLFVESGHGNRRLRIDNNGNIYLLNINDCSVLMYDPSFRFIKRIGSIGQGPDDLWSPRDFTVDSKGNVIIADQGSKRVKIFDPSGKVINSFEVGEIISIDVLSTGQILILKEKDDQLIRVFSQTGKQLGTIGQLVPTGLEDSFAELARYLNGGSLFVDHHDQIYWMGPHLPTPIIRKYHANGALLLEFQPNGPNMEVLSSKAKKRIAQSIKERKLVVTYTMNGFYVNRETNDIWILPSAPALEIYNANGHFKRAFTLRTDILTGGRSLLVLDQRKFVLSSSISGCYLFDLTTATTHSTNKRRPT
jgi:6-bladed beta-propeller